MLTALGLLAASRKFWVGTITMLAIAVGTLLVSLGKIDTTQLAVTIAGVAGVGMTLIGSISWEDAAAKRGTQTSITNTATATKDPK